MIISDKFIWMHVGKAAGTTTRAMFYILKGTVDSNINMNEKGYLPHDNIYKRTTFYENEFKYSSDYLNSLDKILNIRRLPSYILSRSGHAERSHQTSPDKKHMLRGFTEGYSNINHHADAVLNYYIEGAKPKYWLRTEYINEDFITCMKNYYSLDDRIIQRLSAEYKNKNTSYNKDVFQFFTKAELKEIYSKCPLWAYYEQKLYGSLLI